MRVLVVARSCETRTQIIQNLQILQEPSPFEMKLSFNRRQLEDTVQERLGDTETVLLGYYCQEQYHPVRFGELMGMEWFPTRVELHIRCTDFAIIADNDPSLRDGSFKFPLGIRDIPETAFNRSTELRPDSWKSAVDVLSANERCSRTAFFRASSMEVCDFEAHVELETYNPHLSTHHDQVFTLRLVDEGTNEVTREWELGCEYEAEMRSIPLRTEERQYSIRAYPFRQYSLSPSFIVPAASSVSGESVQHHIRNDSTMPIADTASTTISRDDLAKLARKMWRFLDEANELPPDTKRKLLEDYLLQAVPNDYELEQALATICVELGMYEQAVSLLKDSPPQDLSQSSLMSLFTAVAYQRARYPLENLIVHLELGKPEQVSQLSAALKRLDEREASKLIGEVVLREGIIAETDQVGKLLDSFKDFFVDPAAIVDMADYLDLIESADVACDYLDTCMERHPALAVDTTVLSRYANLLERRKTQSGLFVSAVRLGSYYIETGDVAKLGSLIGSIQNTLNKDALLAVYEYISEVKPLGEENEGLRDLRVDMLMQMAELYRESNRLSESAEALMMASMLCKSDTQLKTDIGEGLRQLEMVVEDTGLLRDYMDADMRKRILQLRPTTTGTSLIVVGHYKKPDVADELESELNMRKITWYPTSRSTTIDLESIKEAVRNANERLLGVIYISGFLGHSVSTTLKPICNQHKVAFEPAKPTKLGLVGAIEKLVE